MRIVTCKHYRGAYEGTVADVSADDAAHLQDCAGAKLMVSATQALAALFIELRVEDLFCQGLRGSLASGSS